MGFKRFVAATTKDAMTQVRRELGDDAVILSNKRVANGHIEILAAASHAVEAIVEDARRPAARAAAPGSASVQIAPGVRRVGAAVESFQDFLRRQRPATGAVPARPAAAARPGTVSGASMYSAVAQATGSDDSLDGLADALGDQGAADDGWANSRFDPTLMAPSRIATPSTRGPATSGGAPSRTGSPRTAPAIDTWLPNAARAAAAAQGTVAATPAAAARVAPEATSAGADAPAVFRRRPSRESAPATINVPLDTMRDTTRLPVAAVPTSLAAPEAAVPGVPMTAPSAMNVARATAPLPSMPAAPSTMATPASPLPTDAPAAQVAQVAQVAPIATAAPSILAPAMAEPDALPRTEIRLPAPLPDSASAQLMAELASLRASLQQQLNSLSSTVAATDSMRRHPLQTRVMTRLLTAGFSVEVARRIALNAPELADAEAADAWMQDVLAHNLRCAGPEDSLVDRSGVFALVGPTGVGKTTTVAKIAARFAVRYGAGALGLITLDAYRVAAHEQLRTYGRILGTPVHLAQDVATLRELLASMKNKRLVLIDTCGLGPRDERLPEMLGILAQAGGAAQRIQPVLLLNAASHAETLDDTARAWRAADAVGAMLTKIDEAARIGGALDCALRHKLKLLGLTNGQRVPEDLHQPNARLLAHLALKPANQVFELADDEGAALAVSQAVAPGLARV
jgi:flagellar biosynthesis protein FlhF